jgi:tellurite resistance protein TerC
MGSVLAQLGQPVHWAVFVGIVGTVLTLDFALWQGKARALKLWKALAWVGFCVLLALGFAVWIYLGFGAEPALEFVTGYLVEYALSVDNLFVFLVLFRYFRLARELQRRVLFWGILGAILFRATFVFAGAELIHRFELTILLFGLFLLWTGWKILMGWAGEVDPEKNPILALARRYLRVTPNFEGGAFFVRSEGRWSATPLFLVLVAVEATDVVFAVDSIPAVFGITRDPFLVFTSNIFAVLGLRALFFVLTDFMARFQYLNDGLGLVLVFIGAKMILSPWIHLSSGVSLAVVVTLLGGSVLFSLLMPRKGSGSRGFLGESGDENQAQNDPVDHKHQE